MGNIKLLIWSGMGCHLLTGAGSIPFYRTDETTYTTSIGAWSQCATSCVRTRSVLCLDSKGMLSSEDHCGAIAEIRHYEACTGGQCHKEPTLQPTHTPLSHLDRTPIPGHPVPKPTAKPKSGGTSNSGTVVVGILTTLVDETQSPSLHPTFFPTGLPSPQPTRTYAPTASPSLPRPRFTNPILVWIFDSGSHIFTAVAVLLFAVLVLCLALIGWITRAVRNEPSVHYKRLLVDENEEFDFPEDRDNPFEYFNGDDDDIGGNADTGMSDEIEMVQLPEKAKAEP